MNHQKNHYDALFLSPHLDDAVLSAGGLISQLVKENKKVLLVTLFTKADDSALSLSVRSFLKSSKNYRKSSALFHHRKQEDEKASQILGCDVYHLDFIDALFRKDEEANQLMYKSFQQVFSGKISPLDEPLIEKVRGAVQLQITPLLKKKYNVYAPLGIGSHVDHIITFQIVRELFSKAHFWQDVPYDFEELKIAQRCATLSSQGLSLVQSNYSILHPKLKEKIVSCYDTQLEGLFKAGLQPRHFFQEIFYSRK